MRCRKMSRSTCVRLTFSLFILGTLLAQSQDSKSAGTQASTTSATVDKLAVMPASQQLAHLRVYRQRRYAGSALAPSIYVDDKQVARVGNGRRISVKLSPGSHSIRSDDKSSAITLEVKSSQDYYIRIDEETGFWKGH